MPIQSQGIITKDNVSVDVSAVAYFRIKDAVRSVVAISPPPVPLEGGLAATSTSTRSSRCAQA